MTEQMVISLMKDAFYNVLLVCGPLLMVSMVVGLGISIFQAGTSISEQTLTFVPKLIAVFAVTILMLPFMISTLKTYTIGLINMIPSLK